MSQDLVDRNCVAMDGYCECVNPRTDCKYLRSEKDKEQIRGNDTKTDKEE